MYLNVEIIIRERIKQHTDTTKSYLRLSPQEIQFIIEILQKENNINISDNWTALTSDELQFFDIDPGDNIPNNCFLTPMELSSLILRRILCQNVPDGDKIPSNFYTEAGIRAKHELSKEAITTIQS